MNHKISLRWRLFSVLWAAGLCALAYLIVHCGSLLAAAALPVAAYLFLFLFLPNFYIRATGWLYVRLFYRWKVSGAENIPRTGGVILVCNHVSFVDWLIVAGVTRRPVRFVIDHVYYNIPVLRGILNLVRAIPIAFPKEDKSVLASAYDHIAAEIARGEIVVLFPEGFITRDGRLQKFKPGVMKVLRKSPAPVVPMAISGLWGSFFSRHGGPACQKLPRRLRARVEMRIGEPLAPAAITLASLQASVEALRGPAELK